ncbi:MAG TPA: alpha/beta fold hydrolase [Acidimicrobiales bacterium]|nr:alpha/beta fold hydrolase [Acidimicrobiales bacterium]
MSGPTRHVVDRDWGRLAYVRTGAGPPVVLLHSLALSASMWEPVLGEFAAAHDVVAIDLRGHGASTYDHRPFTVEDMAADVVGLLDDLGIERAHVLGMSMGGSVATVLAAGHPGRVERLVLCDTTAWYGEDAPAQWRARAAAARRRPRELQIPFQVDRWFADGFRRHHPEIVSHVVGIFLRTDPRAHADACLALGGLDARAGLGAVAAPTLVVTGEEDYATPPAMGADLAAGIPSATAAVVAGLRHFAVVESPALRRRILRHLGGGGDEAPPEPVDPCCGSVRGEEER